MDLAGVRVSPWALVTVLLAAVVLTAGCQGPRAGENDRLVRERIEMYVKALAAGDTARLEELEWGEDPGAVGAVQDAAFGRPMALEVVSVRVVGLVADPDDAQLGKVGPQGGIDPQRYRVQVETGAGEVIRLTVAVVQDEGAIWVGSPLLE